MANTVLKLKKKEEVATGTTAFYFDKPKNFLYQAGQYVAMVLPRLDSPDPRGPVRSLSIASAPCEEDLAFAMRNTESGFKETIFAMPVGETVQVTAPIGHFTLSHASDDKPIVFLVGGIGITPVRSILKQAEHDGSARRLVVFYSNRRRQDAAFQDEIIGLRLPHLTVISTLSQETGACTGTNEERGYICEPMLLKHLGAEGLLENWYYLVGAPAFIEAMEKMLGGLGVPKERLVVDPFAGLQSAAQKKK